MLESGSSGSVRGASRNGRPYREPAPEAEAPYLELPRRAAVGVFLRERFFTCNRFGFK